MRVDDTVATDHQKLTQSGAWVGTPTHHGARDGEGAELAGERCLRGRYPFEEPPVIALLSGRPLPAVAWRDAGVEAPLRAFIERALALDPSARPAASELSA